MTEQEQVAVSTDGSNGNPVVIRVKGERVQARRFHLYQDCPTVRDRDPGHSELVPLSEREIELLGVKVCSLCEKRKTGGPAIDALTEILADGNAAWNVVNELKERGFYIAQRRSGSAS